MKKEMIIGIIIMTLISPFASAGIFDWFKDVFGSPGQTEQTDVSVQVGNNPPTIVSVSPIPDVSFIPGSVTNVGVIFTARDSNGVSTLDDATAFVEFTRAGEPTRGGLGVSICNQQIDVGNERTYLCQVPMQFYDEPGVWNVRVGVSDNAAPPGTAEDTSQTVNINPALEILINPAAFSFPAVSPGTTPNALSNVNTIITNMGNLEVPSTASLSVTGFDLAGVNNPSEVIPVANFRASGLSGAIDVCLTGTALIHGSAVTVAGSSLTRGSSATEEFTYCLTSVPAISSQTYDTSGGQKWAISINSP